MGLWDVDKIEYVGRAKGPKEDFAFHYYDADKVVAGKKMKDWLRFGVAWWHTFNQNWSIRSAPAPRTARTTSTPIRWTVPGQGRLRLRAVPEAGRRVLLLPRS